MNRKSVYAILVRCPISWTRDIRWFKFSFSSNFLLCYLFLPLKVFSVRFIHESSLPLGHLFYKMSLYDLWLRSSAPYCKIQAQIEESRENHFLFTSISVDNTGFLTCFHSSILALRIPWAEEPGGLQSWDCKDLDTTKAT